MKRLGLLLLIAPACYGGERSVSGKCPPGETCSPATPYGLEFVPPALFDDFLVASDTQIAVGGTMQIDLDDAADGQPLDLPFTADDGGGPAVRVASTAASAVTLRGAAVGGNEIRIVDASDATLFDRKPFAASAIDHVSITRARFEKTSTNDLAYAIGTANVGIMLAASNGTRLVDTSLTVTGATPSSSWDTVDVPAPAPGTYSFSVTAGGLPAVDFDIVAVDHADSIVAIDPPASVAPGQYGAEVCFGAISGSHSVVGLSWQMTVDGAAVTPDLLFPDCGVVTTNKTSGTVNIVATAGGVSTTLVLPVAAAMRVAPRALAAPDFRGERAAAGD